MTPERFRQIRNLFEAALEREAPLRAPFLAEACQGDEPLRAEVGRLLSAHEKQAGLLDREAARPELLTGEAGKMEGRRIGHYEILRELGRGGMGSVYLAVRTDHVYRKPVAFKVVRPEAGSPEVIERFRREREILASLDHPNIARLLDGGTTPEGLPYFVMDYVEGRPIDAYCDERQMNVAERLKLFRSVCAAVEYAHRRGVVHCDLKPGNVLVTAEGVPKLLDFGIAKLLKSEEGETAAYVTRTGMRLMTPEYASPEQVRGEKVGTASDIYSLGVILYELLTGHRPYHMRSRLIHEVVRVICEEEPTRPSTAVTESEQRLTAGEDKPQLVTPQSVSRSRANTPQGLQRQLSGDPDNILLKALRKDPAQRYASAAALDEDLRRHLDGLPVLAQGESLTYRAGKFLQLHRGWAIATAALVAALAGGILRLSDPSVVLLLGFLPIGVGSYFVVRRQYGHSVASRAVFRVAEVIIILLIIWGMIVTISGSPESWTIWGPFAIVGLLLANSLARWPFRTRWAGPLLLDLVSPKDRKRTYIWASVAAIFVASLGAFVYWANSLPGVRHMGSHDRILIYYVSFPFLGLLVAHGFLTAGRIELRQRGIIISGIWLRWSKIESYAWEDTGGESVALKVRSRKWLLFLFRSTLDIIVPAAQKSPADAILKSQLAEWPGA
jgi:serine/threonine protein kinase